MNRAELIHENFTNRVMAGDFPRTDITLSPIDVGLTDADVADLFESQAMSRLLDLTSRRLAGRKESFYTIGSSGHEGNAALGRVFGLGDMAFLHYRSGAMMIQRSKQLDGEAPLYHTLLSFVASSDDPISKGRHKVFGSKALLVPPQTSTIASHIPKAMGMAHAIGLAGRQGFADATVPHDAVVLCSFGDASANHSTAVGAINTAAWSSYQGSPMPIVFACEDNGIGISTLTPKGWIKANFGDRAGIKYIACDGLNVLDVVRGATAARNYARKYKKPVFLHIRTIRLTGHAGSDVELSYSTREVLEATEAEDPLLHTARILVENNILEPQEICAMYEGLLRRIERIAEKAILRPKLKDAGEVMASIAPAHADTTAKPLATFEQRNELFRTEQHHFGRPQHMARVISLALADIMLQYENVVVMGEDVGKKGGVYGATQGLVGKFGKARVVNTLLDEQSILGLGLGLAHNGFLPLPEIQFLAYVHNAEDQIRGEASTLSFFSDAQFTNPMVVRIAGLAYQKGFGGHFHNDNSVNVFRDIPGIIMACPSNGRDAVQMLRTSVALAHEQKRVVIFIEPIALYMTRDLHEEGDGLWTHEYEIPGTGEAIALGEVGVNGEGKDVCILSYANGFYLSLQARKKLKEDHGIDARVVDLHWLKPLAADAIIEAAKGCKSVLIVDECRRTGSVSEEIMTLFVERGIKTPVARVTAEDSFIPLAEAATLMLPDVASIIDGVLQLAGREA
jgi:2-oxoisovalerate dehydrogenase E1 component